MALCLDEAPRPGGVRKVNDASPRAFPCENKSFCSGLRAMIGHAPTLALAVLFAAGLWLVQRPWALRHWLRDAERGHRGNAALYEAHYGEDPPWLDRFTPPDPPFAIRFARLFHIGGAALMALSALLLYNRLPPVE